MIVFNKVYIYTGEELVVRKDGCRYNKENGIGINEALFPPGSKLIPLRKDGNCYKSLHPDSGIIFRINKKYLDHNTKSVTEHRKKILDTYLKSKTKC